LPTPTMWMGMQKSSRSESQDVWAWMSINNLWSNGVSSQAPISDGARILIPLPALMNCGAWRCKTSMAGASGVWD